MLDYLRRYVSFTILRVVKTEKCKLFVLILDSLKTHPLRAVERIS